MYQFQAAQPAKASPAKARVIAIDFDGVIHDAHNVAPGRKMGAPMPGCKAAMDKLASDGFKLVIWTLRGSDKQHVADWLDYFELPYADITNKKPDALFYIDDKAIRHIDWFTTMRDIGMLLPLFEAPPAR